MTFDPEKTPDFEAIFQQSSPLIRQFPGCRHVELLRELPGGNVYFTLSIWESEMHLEAYRQSELFRSTWAKTKQLFIDKPQAWSLTVC